MPSLPKPIRYVRQSQAKRLLCWRCDFCFGEVIPSDRNGESFAYVDGDFIAAGVRKGSYFTLHMHHDDCLKLGSHPQRNRHRAYQVLGDVAIECPSHGRQVISPPRLGLRDLSRGVGGRQLRMVTPPKKAD